MDSFESRMNNKVMVREQGISLGLFSSILCLNKQHTMLGYQTILYMAWCAKKGMENTVISEKWI